MAPTPPLPVTEDTPPDMLAGSMDLRVVLPGGHAVKMSVERSTPMMDLLVQVTTANKIAPGGHVLQAVGERGVLPYKPSTPIGALDTWTIQIVPKAQGFSTSSLKKLPLKPSNQQPFELTFRLQVHLPRNQLFVARVSPKTLLSDVLHQACTEKNLDPNKYELRHPANLEERLRPDYTLADYKLQEVTLVAKGGRPLGAGLSSSDIMALQKEEEKRRQQARAGGGTGLGLMFNKRSRSSVCDGSISSDSLGGRSISPAHSDETPSPPGSSLPPPRPARKRRPAPKPPSLPSAVISHSRNSSDSSGYHEASVLSESPESNGLSPEGTLPRRSKLTSVVPNQPPGNNLSRSLSNLTTVTSRVNNKMVIQPTDNMGNRMHSVSTSSLMSGHGKKKKAAPPPPPVFAPAKTMPIAEEIRSLPQRTASLTTLSSQSDSIDSYEQEMSLKGPILETIPADKTASLPTLAKQEAIESKTGFKHITSVDNASKNILNIPENKVVLDEMSNKSPERTIVEVYNQPSSGSQSELSSGKSTPDCRTHSRLSSNSHSELSSGKSTPERQIREDSQISSESYSKSSLAKLSPGRQVINNTGVLGKHIVPESHQTDNKVHHIVVEANVHEGPKIDIVPESKPRSVAQEQLQNLPVESASIKVKPDVHSAVTTVPTPKPRIISTPTSAKSSPIPRPRVVHQHIKKDDNPLEQLQLPHDNTLESLDMNIGKEYGSVGRMFGAGTTLVMLTAASTSSTSSSEWKGSLRTPSEFSNQFSDGDVNSVHSDLYNDDEEDNLTLNISENDMEMFEVNRHNKESSKEKFSENGINRKKTGLYDSTMSVGSSVSDSLSGGSWGKSVGRSRDVKLDQFWIRRSFNKVLRDDKKLRADSLNSLKETPSFLGSSRMGRWDNSEKLHEGFESDLEAETEKVQRAFQNFTDELEAAILADEANEVPLPPAIPSPGPGSSSPSIADWEYQLPAPPSAFRDLADSPTPIRDETVVLADTAVFKESPLPLRHQSTLSSERHSPSLDSIERLSPSLDSVDRLSIQSFQDEIVTKTNPVFDAEKFEEEIVRQQSIEVKERLNRVLETNASLINGTLQDEEDDWKPQQLSEENCLQADVELKNAQNNLTHNLSSNNDYNQSNQLKNFTITTYQRPRETNIIYNGESESTNKVQSELNNKEQSEFKKPVPTAVFSKQRGTTNSVAPSNLPRTNSFNSNNESEYPSVKRSTSYISLVNAGRNRTKSIGNISAAASGTEQEPREQDGSVVGGHERLRKTTSEVNISQGTSMSENPRLVELQDQFLQWQEQLLRQTEPDLPLQSLQVLRNILNPASSQERISAPEKVSDQPPVRSSTLPRPTPCAEDDIDTPALQKSTPASLDRSLSTPSNEPSKRYCYQGPPAVNFTTWSERPKSQVSIKVDSDYRIGTGQGSTSTQLPSQEPQKTTKSETETVDRVDSTSTPSFKEDAKPAKPQTTKVEPTALTMRIISHTTASGYKRTPSFLNSRKNFVARTEEPPLQSHSKETPSNQSSTRVGGYNTAQIADPSRVPIVRAVELKKSFVQGSVHADKNVNNSSTKLNWDEVDNQSKNKQAEKNMENDPPEIYQGVNSLAKRFSVVAPSRDNVRVGFRASSARPVSAYLYNGSNETPEPSDTKRNSTSTSNLQNVGLSDSYSGSTVNHSNVNGARKYTSVIGINGAGLSTPNYRDPPVEVNRVQARVSNSASIKVNGFTAAKHPMPVVKGFRFASNGVNHSDASLVAVNNQKSVVNMEPLTVKVQRTHSFSNPNQRSSVIEPASSFNVRIQHTPVAKVDPAVVRVQQPVPPPAPVMKMPVRPKSFHATNANPRDQLMDAIRNFGGRESLRQNGDS